MNPLMQYTTKQLVEELARREGVEEMVVAPEESYKISDEEGREILDTGPARILVVID